MPKIAQYTLVWSPLHQAYELHESLDGGILDVAPESAAWLTWASQISSFAFHGKNGSYTACKERKQRGEGYWYAYARIAGKLTKQYLGRSKNLTLLRMEQVAQKLWLNTSNTLDIFQADRSQADRLADRQADRLADRQADRLADRQADRSQTDHPQADRKGRPYMLETVVQTEGSALTTGQQDGGYTEQNTSSTPTQRPSDLLLATKLQVPRPRSHLMHRPRLIRRLQQGMERALTLISAPVGSGKSTLLSDWLISQAIPAAWLSLEPQDNEPIRFLSYLLAALRSYNPRLNANRQILHSSLQPPLMEAMLTLLINDLLAERSSHYEHFVLVLDNYQVITDETIHHAMSFLVNHRPLHMHIVLSTREDPPLALAQLRGRDDVLEIRASDLRFSPEEAATFLTKVMEMPLSMEESALLQARTEGWITGLQLAAFSLQGRDKPGDFIRAFNGSHHYIVDYLLEEVLQRQSEDVQEFLLQTCILDRMSAPLCDAVRKQDGSQALLDFLERTNLFVVALDDERQWYRYQRLFAEALRQRLRQVAPTLVPELHQRASRWFEQHGFYTEAAFHELAAPVPQFDALVEPLTTREREVLQLLLTGASNREIACSLVLSMNTVKKHVSNICRKLRVRSRAQAVVKARGLL